MVIEAELIQKFAASKISEFFANRVVDSMNEKKSYSEKLESATGDSVFKYILLINISALEGYIAQTRIQAQQSFKLSKIIALVGFVILSIAILLSIYSTVKGNGNLNSAYLGGVAGVITEFTSAVFFYLYNKTLQQVNLFHDKLISMQHISMSYLATDLIQNEDKKDQAKIDISMQLMDRARTNSS